MIGKRRRELERKRAENGLLGRQIEGLMGKVEGLKGKDGVVGEAGKFLVGLANGRRGEMKGRVEGVVTEAMRLLYGGGYRAELVYGVRGGRSSLEVEMVRGVGGVEVRRGMEGFGGGVADVMSVPLRLMAIMGSKVDRVCVLDECYRHLDSGRVEMVGGFLGTLTGKLGVQVLMVTHHVGLSGGREYKLRDDGGRVVVCG